MLLTVWAKVQLWLLSATGVIFYSLDIIVHLNISYQLTSTDGGPPLGEQAGDFEEQSAALWGSANVRGY